MALRIPTPAGTLVRCYKNLTRDCWSVQARLRTGQGKQHGWKVVGHADTVLLDHATFKVYEPGRQRVLKTGIKNVHAFVIGTLVALDQEAGDFPVDGTYAPVGYNPKRWAGFINLTKDLDLDAPLLTGATRLWLTADGHVDALGAW